MKISFVLFLLILSVNSNADTCQDWFNALKIKGHGMCLSKCEAAPVGMDSFMCHDRCEEFCKSLSINALGAVAYYPGLNFAERKLIARYH